MNNAYVVFPVMIILVFIGFFVGLLVGHVRGRLAEQRKGPQPVRAICPCEHSIGAHKDGKSCLAQIKRPFYAHWGSRNGYEWVQCPCTKYWGPEPVLDFFHPGMIAK